MLTLLIALWKTFKDIVISRVIFSICKTKTQLQQIFAEGKTNNLFEDSLYVMITRFNLQINEQEKTINSLTQR